MTSVDPSAWLADAALTAVWDALPQARIVGGAVRDLIAGKPVADVDLATPLAPESVMAALGQAGIKAVPTGLAHGTITAVSGGRGFEITTLRRDVSTDGRHAVVAFTTDWQQDAARRDFTINAMSAARDGELFDYYGGADDLAAGRIRFVGDPDQRIAEDYLRILRFFRFHARYGQQDPDIATQAALRNGVSGLGVLSVERIWHEMRLLLAIPAPWESVAWMRRLGIWATVMPEAPKIENAVGVPADPILRLAALLDGSPRQLSERLKLSNDDRDRLVRLVTTPLAAAGDSDAALRRLLADHAAADLVGRAWIEGDGDRVARLQGRLATIPQPRFPLVGRDVTALGVAPGPRVGELLRLVRHWWIEGGCTADRDACRAELKRQSCAES
jgi:poly(A) polymerase